MAPKAPRQAVRIILEKQGGSKPFRLLVRAAAPSLDSFDNGQVLLLQGRHDLSGRKVHCARASDEEADGSRVNNSTTARNAGMHVLLHGMRGGIMDGVQSYSTWHRGGIGTP